eukprot:2538336-Rhodomonas_salina.1
MAHLPAGGLCLPRRHKPLATQQGVKVGYSMPRSRNSQQTPLLERARVPKPPNVVVDRRTPRRPMCLLLWVKVAMALKKLARRDHLANITPNPGIVRRSHAVGNAHAARVHIHPRLKVLGSADPALCVLDPRRIDAFAKRQRLVRIKRVQKALARQWVVHFADFHKRSLFAKVGERPRGP